MHQTTELSHNDAFSLVDLVKTDLERRGAGAAIAVVDSHGELLAFLRCDNCPLPSINNALNKAFTSAREKVESLAIGKASREDPFPITNFGDLRYTGWGGGVPISFDGKVIGALGVSGLPEADDVEIARSAVSAFENILNSKS